MSLRNLLFDIAFNGSANPIIEMNSATDELRETAMGAIENIEGMETATEELGQTTDGVGRLLQDNWKKVTLAASAAAGAIETMARNQAEMTEQTKRLSSSLGIAEDEMRQLAIATSNVTFPLNDVLDLFEIARQQGLRTADDIQEFAWFWDTVGDATKENAIELAKGSQGLRAVGIAAGEEEKALSAFGYITEHTTSTVSDLLSFLQRTGPELRELGLDIDDTAAIMGILEHEMGMAGRMAISEFTKAVNESEGEVALMLNSLGIAPEVFQTYQSAVDASSDIIQRNADLHAESYTNMQKLQHKVEELNYQYAPFIELLSGMVPILLILGPAMKGVSTISEWWGKINFTTLIPSIKASAASMAVNAKGAMAYASVKLKSLIPATIAATKTFMGFTATLLANPMTWVVIGIVALIAAGIALYKNWDKVSEKLGGIWDSIKDIWGNTVEFLNGIDLVETGRNIIQGLINGIKSMASSAVDAVTNVASSIGNSIKNFFGINSPAKLTMEYGVNIGEGLDLGMSNSIPEIETTTRQINELIAPELSRTSNDINTNKDSIGITEAPLSRTITNNNRSNMTFSPQITVSVGAGTNAREVANSLEREFDLLMERYAKKISLRNPALTEA